MQVALPGGFFYVHAGLILSGGDESELAGVMARMRSRRLRRATRRSKRRRPQYEAKPKTIRTATIPIVASRLANLETPFPLRNSYQAAERDRIEHHEMMSDVRRR